eukprot:m.31411 g.31411  ORF g.31411 m.31411 type:complete len:204 (+) comp9741_c0_seq1:685-1296(+)
MGAEQSVSLDETLFNLRFTSKRLESMHKTAEKEEKKAKAKVKKCLQQKNPEAARIYAENAIRKKNEGLNFLRMAARVDAVRSRVQTAQQMNQITKEMGGVVRGLDTAMSAMNLEKMTTLMDQFETKFMDIDVGLATMDGAMNSATTQMIPEDSVDGLIQEVADENQLEVAWQLDQATVPQNQQAQAEAKAEDDLSARLAALRS